MPRVVVRGSRGVHHGAARAAVERRAGARHDSLELGSAAFLDYAHLRSRHGPAESPAARPGAHHDRRADPAHLGSSAAALAAALVDQPDDEDRHLLEGAFADRAVVDRSSYDPATAAPRTRRRQRRRMGPAQGAAASARRSGAPARTEHLAERSHGGHGQRSRRRAAATLARRIRRYGWIHRVRLPAASGQPRRPGRGARGLGEGELPDQYGRRRPSGRHRGRRHRASASDRRRRCQRRCRACSSSWRNSLAQTRWR